MAELYKSNSYLRSDSKDDECIFIGSYEDCKRAEEIISEYYNGKKPYIYIKTGTEQEHIANVLFGTEEYGS